MVLAKITKRLHLTVDMPPHAPWAATAWGIETIHTSHPTPAATIRALETPSSWVPSATSTDIDASVLTSSPSCPNIEALTTVRLGYSLPITSMMLLHGDMGVSVKATPTGASRRPLSVCKLLVPCPRGWIGVQDQAERGSPSTDTCLRLWPIQRDGTCIWMLGWSGSTFNVRFFFQPEGYPVRLFAKTALSSGHHRRNFSSIRIFENRLQISLLICSYFVSILGFRLPLAPANSRGNASVCRWSPFCPALFLFVINSQYEYIPC